MVCTCETEANTPSKLDGDRRDLELARFVGKAPAEISLPNSDALSLVGARDSARANSMAHASVDAEF
jgi:hypothetical protein